MVLHVDSNAVDDIIDIIYRGYGQDPETPLTVHNGKAHNYLWMTINYNTKEIVVFTMFDYIKNVLDKSQEEFCRRSETPVANHLFYVD